MARVGKPKLSLLPHRITSPQQVLCSIVVLTPIAAVKRAEPAEFIGIARHRCHGTTGW